MSEAGKMAARLPPIAWVMPNDRCRDDGSLDAMAWQEGEFSTPLCSRDAALELLRSQEATIAEQAKVIEGLRAALKPFGTVPLGKVPHGVWHAEPGDYEPEQILTRTDFVRARAAMDGK